MSEFKGDTNKEMKEQRKIKLSEFSIENIQNGEYENTIPELYELREIIEDNISHDNDPVFDHTLSVLTELDKLMDSAEGNVAEYLLGRVGKSSRREILFLAAVFHDIAKKETIKEEEGDRICPGHEKEGVKKFATIANRFDITDDEKELVGKIIKHHSFFIF